MLHKSCTLIKRLNAFNYYKILLPIHLIPIQSISTIFKITIKVKFIHSVE